MSFLIASFLICHRLPFLIVHYKNMKSNHSLQIFCCILLNEQDKQKQESDQKSLTSFIIDRIIKMDSLNKTIDKKINRKQKSNKS